MNTARREMQLYSRYLTGISASETICARFEQAAIFKLESSFNPVVPFVLRHPWTLPLFDNATGWFVRQHPLRFRLELAFAILETTTESAGFFMPESRSFLYLFVLVWRGGRSLVQGFFGLLLLQFLK